MNDPKVLPRDQKIIWSKSPYIALEYPPMVREDFLKEAKIRKSGSAENRQVLKKFYLTTKAYFDLY